MLKLGVSARKYVHPTRVAALASYFGKVSVGQSVDIRTPFWDSKSRLEIISDWSNTILHQLPKGELFDLEFEQAKKCGPMSIQLPLSERIPDVLQYYRGDAFKGDKRLLDDAVEIVSSKILSRKHTLRPISMKNAANYMQSTTNSGLPYFSKRNSVLDLDLALANTNEVPPAILGWRGQSSGKAIPKQRVVWMFPQSVNLREMRYFVPLFEVMRNLDECAAWNNLSRVDDVVSSITSKPGTDIISLDFSGFDQSIQRTMRNAAMNVIANCFQRQFKSEIELLEQAAGNIELLTPAGLFHGEHGEPSGSTLTNMRDTLVNWISAEYVSLRLGISYKATFQGDDAILRFFEDVDLEKLEIIYGELGLIVNREKQYVSDNSAMYLQRLHTSQFQWNNQLPGIYPTMRALNSLMGMERFHQDWDGKMFSLRAIMILENTKHHPLFKQFVEFAVKGDKFKLGLKLPGGLKELIRSIDRAKTIPGFVSSYNSPKMTGIADFEVIKLLREMN